MKNFRRLLIPLLIAVFSLAGALVALPVVSSPQEVSAAPMLARAVLTPTSITLAGVEETMTTSSGEGMQFVNNNATWVRIDNSYSETITATFITPREINGLPIEDLDVAVEAGEVMLSGPFPGDTFNNAGNLVYIDFNAEVTGTVANSVTLGAFRLQ